MLDRLMRRMDPQVAASFTDEQRAAMADMLASRSRARHMVEIRRSLCFRGRRYYLVFLLGAEQRSLARLHKDGLIARPLSVLVYLGLAAPLLGLAIGYLAATGI